MSQSPSNRREKFQRQTSVNSPASVRFASQNEGVESSDSESAHLIQTDMEGSKPGEPPNVLDKFNNNKAAKNPVPGSLNYDIEAVERMDHSRRGWPSTGRDVKTDRNPSISSDESLSEYEELGASGMVNEDSSHRYSTFKNH